MSADRNQPSQQEVGQILADQRFSGGEGRDPEQLHRSQCPLTHQRQGGEGESQVLQQQGHHPGHVVVREVDLDALDILDRSSEGTDEDLG